MGFFTSGKGVDHLTLNVIGKAGGEILYIDFPVSPGNRLKKKEVAVLLGKTDDFVLN